MKLKDLCLIQSGGTPSRTHAEYWNNGSIPWVKISDFSGKKLSQTEETITELGLENSSAKVFPKGTLLYTIFATLGKVCLLDIDAATNQAIAGLTITSNLIMSDYLFYFLSSLERYVNNAGRGVAQNNINLSILREIDVPVPDLLKQSKISAVLEKVDSLIETHKIELSLLDSFVKSRFVELFGDPIENPLNWSTITLKEACTKLTDGTHFSPESYSEGSFKYITAKSIKEDGFDFSNLTYVSEEVHRSVYERCNPEKGDILYIKDGATTGIAMINTLNEEFTMLSSVALIKHDRSLLCSQFLKTLLNYPSFYDSMRKNMGGAAITRLTVKKLHDTRIIIPPIDRQTFFSTFAEKSDKSKFYHRRWLNHTTNLLNSLMRG